MGMLHTAEHGNTIISIPSSQLQVDMWRLCSCPRLRQHVHISFARREGLNASTSTQCPWLDWICVIRWLDIMSGCPVSFDLVRALHAHVTSPNQASLYAQWGWHQDTQAVLLPCDHVIVLPACSLVLHTSDRWAQVTTMMP